MRDRKDLVAALESGRGVRLDDGTILATEEEIDDAIAAAKKADKAASATGARAVAGAGAPVVNANPPAGAKANDKA